MAMPRRRYGRKAIVAEFAIIVVYLVIQAIRVTFILKTHSLYRSSIGDRIAAE